MKKVLLFICTAILLISCNSKKQYEHFANAAKKYMQHEVSNHFDTIYIKIDTITERDVAISDVLDSYNHSEMDTDAFKEDFNNATSLRIVLKLKGIGVM